MCERTKADNWFIGHGTILVYGLNVVTQVYGRDTYMLSHIVRPLLSHLSYCDIHWL